MASTLALTGTPDIDIIILNNLDDEDLSNVCRVNRYINSLCRGKELWILRISQRFPDAGRFRPDDMTQKEYYFLLSRILLSAYPSGTAITYGYVSILEWLSTQGFLP